MQSASPQSVLEPAPEILAIVRSPDYVASLITGGLLVVVTIVWAPDLAQWFRTTRVADAGRT